jgi:C1A family cysteine protease
MVRTEIILVIALLITMAVVPIAGAAGDELQAAPINPDFIRYMEAKDTNMVINTLNAVAQDDAQPLGLIPSPIFRPGIKDIQMFGTNDGDRTTTDPDVFALQTSGPLSPVINQTRFDLRATGRVSPVRNQDPWGTCWAFATYGSLESTLMATGTAPDFSEKNLVNLAGFSQPGTRQEAGGQMWMSTAYLTRWNGPVDESTDPYPLGPKDNWSSSNSYPPTKHVQNVVFFPARTNSTDNANIKGALVQWGAVYSSFCWFEDFYNGTYTSYYQPAANLSTDSGHAVTIAGWDDTYEAKNFTVIPEGPGAWIVKNSWGPGWGDAGYFYISYYDKHFGSAIRPDGGNRDTAAFLGESTSNYDRVYSYDRLGEVNDIWYNTKKTGGFANVFTANSSENITAIGFYTTDMNVPCTISIYKNPTSGPIGGSPAATFNKTLPYMGYNTVNIPSNLQVPVTRGMNFSVVIQVTNPTNDYYIPIEQNQGNYTANITSDFGQGYLWGSSGWVDLNTTIRNNSHVCVKAYTSSITAPPNPNMLNGTIYYAGTQNAPVYVYLFNQAPAPGVIPFKTQTLTYSGTPINYGFTAGSGTFWVMAYMDLNGNYTPDANEPWGFAINKTNRQVPDPIPVTGNMTGLDITLFEPQLHISLSLTKDFTVSTTNNTILAGTQDNRMRYQMLFFPTIPGGNELILGNLSFALAAQNISDVDYKQFAVWNSSSAIWTFPSEFALKTNNGLSVTADTSIHADKLLNMSLSRKVNQTVFAENGTQLLTANITFTSTEFLSAACILDIPHTTLVNARFVPVSVRTDAPTERIEVYDQWILFLFNRSEIKTDVPYSLLVSSQVEPNGTPVEFIPRVSASQTFYRNSSPGTFAPVGVMPAILLPKKVSNASAANNVSGIWEYYTEDSSVAILERVARSVPPVPVLNNTIINQSATIFIGEQGLNVTHALNQAQGNPSIDGVPPLKLIGWWASGAEVNTTAPTKTINLNSRYTSFTVMPADFVGYTGTWYVIRDDQTAAGVAFTVTDPSLDLRILDFTHAADVTGKSVPQNTRLGFGIATNMYPAVDARYRSPINPATDGYITIKVKNASGSTWQSLYNSSASAGTIAGPNTLLANFVNVQPWAWGGNHTWSWQTSARDTQDQPAYPPGIYTASAESTLNHMKDNYKMAGADYTGKTVSPTYTLNLRLCGEFNSNNAVDIGDTARVAYMVVGLTPVDMAADFNGAGSVDTGDAAKIAMYIVGKVPALC